MEEQKSVKDKQTDKQIHSGVYRVAPPSKNTIFSIETDLINMYHLRLNLCLNHFGITYILLEMV